MGWCAFLRAVVYLIFSDKLSLKVLLCLKLCYLAFNSVLVDPISFCLAVHKAYNSKDNDTYLLLEVTSFYSSNNLLASIDSIIYPNFKITSANLA